MKLKLANCASRLMPGVLPGQDVKTLLVQTLCWPEAPLARSAVSQNLGYLLLLEIYCSLQ
jgi:hypothetical protein